ncbi:MAG: NPCBM/NEW2 domain-containing protein [Verrucomicrobia bacterium]|nr:NPCBM/NEW2 domain-containing protein [Verrucomicrobiota bacterium]
MRFLLARRIALSLVATLMAMAAVSAGADTPPPIRPPHQAVYIVYFNPADRECLPRYQERVDRVMTEVTAWYAKEMKRNGFGERTFPLERDEDGKLIIHVVNGSRVYAEGEAMGHEEIRDKQVKPVLLGEGIDIDQEHIIIFQNLNFVTEGEGEISVRCWAPYCGGGGTEQGTAWVTDYALLDVENLSNTTMMVDLGFKEKWTLSRYVISHLGGVAHEFGHALGLPHNAETDAQRAELGTALMGSGNYHLFAERISDDKGAYLTKAHATILSSHPLFNPKPVEFDGEVTCTFHDVAFAAGDGEYTVSGRVETTPRAYAVVAYHDGRARAMDYDATSWVAGVDDEGRFAVRVGALTPGRFELHVGCCLVNGERRFLSYEFDVDQDLQVPIEVLKRQTIYELYANPAIDARDAEAMHAAVDKLKGVDDIQYRRAVAYLDLMTRKPVEPKRLGELGDNVREVQLSQVTWESADVGWDEPTRGSVPVRDEDDNRKDMPLESGERFHETGLYAHADSRYVFNLDGAWKSFTSGYGLENRCQGSVVFVIKCDGEERFRSDLIDDWTEHRVEIDVMGVKQLELIASDNGDGHQGDCAIWFSPILKR